MKWAYSIRRKISAALLLTAIFAMLFVTNIIDNKNVSQLGSSFSSVYEDRLLVESYIYRMSENLFRKKFLLDTCSNEASALHVKPLIDNFNAHIQSIIADYEQTKLTADEVIYFSELKENLQMLMVEEARYFNSLHEGEKNVTARTMINNLFNEASYNLDRLSSIQLSEGKILNEHSKKIVAGSSLLTAFEVAILIAVGLLILVLVFESKERIFTSSHKQSLN